MDTALEPVARDGLVLLGCGKMGQAMLSGWLAAGLPPERFAIVEPKPAPHLAGLGVRINPPLPAKAAAVVLAVKPQFMEEALPQVAPLAGSGTIFLSIAAGLKLSWFEARLGAGTPVVRAMPNTPAAVGRGISALIPNGPGAAAMPLAEALLAAVGQTVRLEAEAQMDAVTALSGSGPAYVFHMIEAMAAAGEAEGLAPDLAMALARATVCGAGELAFRSEDSAAQLRINVTSPAGTTAAALNVLMDEADGLPPLMRRAVAAASARSRELGG